MATKEYVTSRVPSDVVKAVFHYLGEEERFPADIPKIHSFFYKLSKRKGYRTLLSDFVFDPTKSFPYSLTVTFALERLQKSKLLSCINPGLDQFMVTKKLASKSDVDTLFDPNERKRLQDCAKLFLHDLSSQ